MFDNTRYLAKTPCLNKYIYVV